ncbi:MAG: ectoine hydroxylase-related dioxygenase (phytanoyl-CoA dioxygenase family) [Pirellulaceae bacterium]|jgi:ectoine hydroxylase-related dioxygenase (phytanoyl-CoA dioxygenase family)
MKDLSTAHEIVSDLIKIPQTQAEWEPYRLSDEQVEFYREQGYLAGIRLLSEAQVDSLRSELADFFEPEHEGRELWYEYHSNESANPDTVLFHALGAWRIKPGFHDILWNPAFTMAASQLLEGAVRFWHDQLFCKPAKHGGVVAWHQDYSYWTRTKPMAHLTCWIGLDDADKDNGCLQYIPKSHKWELLPVTGLAGDMAAIQEVLNEQQWEQFQSPVAIELKLGECSFHHPLMVHGSFENRTERSRRATVINVFRDGVRSDAGEPMLDGTDTIPAGDCMGGRFYPMLLQRP